MNFLANNAYDFKIEIIVFLLFTVITLIAIAALISLAIVNHKKSEQSGSNAKKKHWLLKLFAIYFAVIIVVFYGAQLVDCLTNSYNKDGWWNPFSRSAQTADISVKQSFEISGLLDDNYKVKARTEIDNLEITIFFMDEYKHEITTKTKNLGHVDFGTAEYKFSFSLSEFTADEILTIKTWCYEVTGGTVSYFARALTNF